MALFGIDIESASLSLITGNLNKGFTSMQPFYPVKKKQRSTVSAKSAPPPGKLHVLNKGTGVFLQSTVVRSRYFLSGGKAIDY
jgi:hypothetical protein